MTVDATAVRHRPTSRCPCIM